MIGVHETEVVEKHGKLIGHDCQRQAGEIYVCARHRARGVALGDQASGDVVDIVRRGGREPRILLEHTLAKGIV